MPNWGGLAFNPEFTGSAELKSQGHEMLRGHLFPPGRCSLTQAPGAPEPWKVLWRPAHKLLSHQGLPLPTNPLRGQRL